MTVERIWARAIAAGMDDDLFWASTPAEASLVMEELREIERERQLADQRRAALITVAVLNTHRRPGSRAFKISDFAREPARVVSGEEAQQILRSWARGHNGVIEA